MSVTYGYDEFTKKLKESGLTGQFSEADLKLAKRNPEAGMGLITAKQAYQNAKTDEERAQANRSAEQLRQTYGNYSAGASGSGYMPGSKSPDTFQYDSFSYDPQTDRLYQAYKKQYVRQGRQASADTMGNLAAMTGGMPSSYAATAAAQAGNHYAAALSDKVPELYQAAYGQYQADRGFAYQQHKDAYTSDQAEKNQALANAQNAAAYGDYSWLNALGIKTDNYLKEREFENLLSQQAYEAGQTEKQWAYDYAKLAAQVKDYGTVKDLTGITADNSGERMEMLYNIAAQLAKAGDYSLLYQLLSGL